MKVPKYIKENLNKQAELMAEIRKLESKFMRFCGDKNIDVDCRDFTDCYSYVLGDCSAENIIGYLECDLDIKGKEK